MTKDGELYKMSQQIRDTNYASSRTTSDQLCPLRAAPPSVDGNDCPEIVVVQIPDVKGFPGNAASGDAPAAAGDKTAPREVMRAELSDQGRASDANRPETYPYSEQTVGQHAIHSDSGDSAELAMTSANPNVLPAGETASNTQLKPWWYSVSDVAQDRAIGELVRRIVVQFPSSAPASLLFASADSDLSTNRTTARVAAALARHTGCRALLIDANWETNIAPLKSGPNAVAGLTEVLSENRRWQHYVIETEDPLLHVLPCGIADVPMRRISPEALRALYGQWQREYTYVCVNAGNARQLITRRMAACCDGAYVLVGLHQTTKKEAQSAMKLLAENHARILGAVVFDSARSA